MASLANSLAAFGLKLLQQHDERLADAKNENTAVFQIVPLFDSSLTEIFAAANSGQISESSAIQYLKQTQSAYWANFQRFTGEPGVAGNMLSCLPCVYSGGQLSNGGDYQTATICGKGCTASCCVGCDAINCAIDSCIRVFQQGGGTAHINGISENPEYGSSGRAPYTLTYTAPSPVASVLSDLGLSSAPSPISGASSSGLVSGMSTNSLIFLAALLGIGGSIVAAYIARGDL